MDSKRALALVMWCAPLLAAAAEPAAESAALNLPQALATTRESVRATVEWAARGIDSWFGDKPFREGGSVTDGEFSLGGLWRQDRGFATQVRLNARLRLPNVERRAYLFIGRENEREAITDTPSALTRQQRLLPETRDQTSTLGGLGLALDRVELRVGVRGGLKPYAQARLRQVQNLGPDDRAEVGETLFWTVADHVGVTTGLSLEHAFTPTLAGRWLTAGTITQVSRKFEWTSSLGLFRDLGNWRRLGLEAITSGGQAPGIGISDVGAQLHWQQPVHHDWLIGELVIGHFWPRSDASSDANRGWAAGLILKMLF